MARSTVTYDVKAPMEREAWQESGRRVWVRVGYANQLPDGVVLVTLNAVPVGPRWDGTLKLFPRDDR